MNESRQKGVGNAREQREGAGKVWLVGAGPGDPGLLTVRGRECIAQADVVVYDSLCNPVLLEHARDKAERIHAGKRAGRHSMKQDDINALLCEKALAGKAVCRLKGGDPFVFGRGGEEALYLRERGVPVEVVPGVTSAVAAPAYAGIPVTHRGVAASVRIVTGHEDPTKPESDVDWKELAATSGTLVFLMGVRNLPLIAERLIACGRAPDTSAALVSNGTLPTQRTVAGTLAALPRLAEEQGIEPPATLVVGEVARLRETLAWFEERPLFGRSIVVTRARAQASELVAQLRALGADVLEAPTIRIENLGHTPAMHAAVREASDCDWVVFTSVNAVDAFYEALCLEGLDVRVLANSGVAAIGSTTGEHLRERGLLPDLVPERFVAEALLEAFDKTETFTGQRYLLPHSDIAPPDLADGLRERGAEVVDVAAYRTMREGPLPEAVLERLAGDSIDLVTFTSSSTVTNFIADIPEERRASLLPRVRAASIGPITSKTLSDAGIDVAVEAEQSTIGGLVEAVLAHLARPRA